MTDPNQYGPQVPPQYGQSMPQQNQYGQSGQSQQGNAYGAPTSNPSKEPHNTVHRNMALRKASRPRKARISLR